MSNDTTCKEKFSKKMPMLHINAAGIDIGSTRHYVAVPPDRDEESVKNFDIAELVAMSLHY